MSKTDEKHRFVVLIDKEIFAKFKVLAQKENRTAGNLAAKMLIDYVKENEKRI